MNVARANREMAAVARSAAEIIQARGKATGVEEDEQGRVCAIGALAAAGRGYHLDLLWMVLSYASSISTLQSLRLQDWSDLPTTTEQDIAKVFLQVADEIEVALILLCRAAEAADENRADDLMALADEVQRDDFHLWQLEIKGQR